MDILELAVPLVIHWRIGLAVLATAILALMLTIVFVPFTGLHALLLVIVGFGAGMLWDGSPRPVRRKKG
jgi:hypothetical protein